MRNLWGLGSLLSDLWSIYLSFCFCLWVCMGDWIDATCVLSHRHICPACYLDSAAGGSPVPLGTAGGGSPVLWGACLGAAHLCSWELLGAAHLCSWCVGSSGHGFYTNGVGTGRGPAGRRWEMWVRGGTCSERPRPSLATAKAAREVRQVGAVARDFISCGQPICRLCL